MSLTNPPIYVIMKHFMRKSTCDSPLIRYNIDKVGVIFKLSKTNSNMENRSNR